MGLVIKLERGLGLFAGNAGGELQFLLQLCCAGFEYHVFGNGYCNNHKFYPEGKFCRVCQALLEGRVLNRTV